ncbi:MAG: hypothetical protein M3270_08035 [Thermoproteota archaeon]|nr:hypothetical protein [Thermoproteota archaeon]
MPETYGDNNRLSESTHSASTSNDENQTPDHKSSEILEYGDIFFFYRPKVGADQVRGIDDVRRFFMITATESRKPGSGVQEKEKQFENSSTSADVGKSNMSTWYRLFTIGKKSLPEVRRTEARRSERYWAKIGGIFRDSRELTNELLSSEFREGVSARPVGEGKYAIVNHENHAELAYILEMPKDPGGAQQELGIEKEASYIVSVINPKVPVPQGYPSTEQPPEYPQFILDSLGQAENFIPLSKDIRLIDFLNAQVILIGAREGKDVLKKEIGIDIKDEEESERTSDIFSKLQIERNRTPIKPLIEGKFE